MFPLNEDEEKALFGDDNADKTPERRSVCGLTPAAPKNSNSQLSPASVTGASLPSGGQNKNNWAQCLAFLHANWETEYFSFNKFQYDPFLVKKKQTTLHLKLFSM